MVAGEEYFGDTIFLPLPDENFGAGVDLRAGNAGTF